MTVKVSSLIGLALLVWQITFRCTYNPPVTRNGKIQAIRFSSSEKIMTLDDILYTTLVKFSNGAQK